MYEVCGDEAEIGRSRKMFNIKYGGCACKGKPSIVAQGAVKEYKGVYWPVAICVCEKCGRHWLYFNGYGSRATPPKNGAFVFFRDRTTPAPKPKPLPDDKYTKYARKHGISRLHAIHELDGA